MLSLAANLCLSGGFIGIVKLLLRRVVQKDNENLKKQVLDAQGKGAEGPNMHLAVANWNGEEIVRVCFQGWRFYTSLRRRQDQRRKLLHDFFRDHYAEEKAVFQGDVTWLFEDRALTHLPSEGPAGGGFRGLKHASPAGIMPMRRNSSKETGLGLKTISSPGTPNADSAMKAQ